jgi:hypothetical protein
MITYFHVHLTHTHTPLRRCTLISFEIVFEIHDNKDRKPMKKNTNRVKVKKYEFLLQHVPRGLYYTMFQTAKQILQGSDWQLKSMGRFHSIFILLQPLFCDTANKIILHHTIFFCYVEFGSLGVRNLLKRV